MAVGDLSRPVLRAAFLRRLRLSGRRGAGRAASRRPACSCPAGRWRCRDGRTVAVANLVVDAGTPIEPAGREGLAGPRQVRCLRLRRPAFTEPAAAAGRGVGGRRRRQHYAGRGHPGPRADRGGGLRRRSSSPGPRTWRPNDAPSPAGPEWPAPALRRLLRLLGRQWPRAELHRREPGAAAAGARTGVLLTEALAGSIAPGGDGAARTRPSPARSSGTTRSCASTGVVLESIVRRLAALGLTARAPGQARGAAIRQRAAPAYRPPRGAARGGAAAGRGGPAAPDARGRRDPRARPRCRVIAGLEGFPRGLYAGALGWVDCRGGGEFFVGLRSALIDGRAGPDLRRGGHRARAPTREGAGGDRAEVPGDAGGAAGLRARRRPPRLVAPGGEIPP